MPDRVLARFGDSASRAADAASALREATGRPGTDADDARRPAAGGTRQAVPLTTLARQAGGTVAGVRLPQLDAEHTESDPALERMALRLIEIGFVQGARLRVIAFGQPGDDPIGVRVGGRGGVSTFALRRAEAACVWVWAD